ncbi:MAG: HAD family hydrolase [Candidatus Omnitrophica bacterium]|nr:HAD family hydrolase [Candidatus Omnitrophota bacterium]
MEKVKVVFLDRDGVVNKYPGDFNYVTSVEEFQLLPNVKSALEKLTASGFKLFVVSNQAGVAKGLYSLQDLNEIDSRMVFDLGDKVRISETLYCTHRPEENCSCRKPKTGLIDEVVADLKDQGFAVDKEHSYFVGDSMIDIETGQSAGLKTILVFSGREKPQNQLHWDRIPDYKADDLSSAAQIIISS